MNDDTAMAGALRFLGRGMDTLIVNIYPTDSEGDVVKERLPEVLEQELTLYKERAQGLDEEVPTRWVFQGENLFMKDKGGSHFKWILTCQQFTVAVSRGIKVRCGDKCASPRNTSGSGTTILQKASRMCWSS